MTLSELLIKIDDIVWGPAMLILLVGTGLFLTIRTKALCLRNLPYAVLSVFSKESRTKKGDGDITPFSALTTALASTIGTGNIVGVATAMVSGGPGALVWMWVSALFGLSSKFAECMLAIKYREVNCNGEMSGGPMYTIKNAFKNKRVASVLAWLFALFTIFASFGVGNLTQANSISSAFYSTFNIPTWIVGSIIVVLILIIVYGGINSISKVSQVIVPFMAVFYIAADLIIIFMNIENLPEGLAMIIKMAFSYKAVGGGLCGTIVASMMKSMRFGFARGIFSNEAGMGSAAISSAAANTNDAVRQGYISMTGTFFDTLVVCTITGLCLASSGLLGTSETVDTGNYQYNNSSAIYLMSDNSDEKEIIIEDEIVLSSIGKKDVSWTDDKGNTYIFNSDGSYDYKELLIGASLTLAVFEQAYGKPGGWLLSIAIAFFAFSTILGWEFNGEKAMEYLMKSPKYNRLYRLIFSVIIFIGATTTLTIAWSFSDIANALMAIPNLISLIVLSGVVADEIQRFQPILEEEKKRKKK